MLSRVIYLMLGDLFQAHYLQKTIEHFATREIAVLAVMARLSTWINISTMIRCKLEAFMYIGHSLYFLDSTFALEMMLPTLNQL